MRFTKSINKLFLSLLLISASLQSINAFAQYDSTNLPGLSTSYQTPNNTSSGSGVPDPAVLSPSTSYTETMVQACPSSGGNGYGYYPNGPVPADGTNVAGQTVTGGVVYDQTVTTNRFGTTTYSGWYQVNFLCTAIPYPPGCPSGQVQTVAPYWDWGTNSWQGLQCTTPAPPAPTCTYDANNYVHRSIPPFWGSPDYYSAWDSSIDFKINGVAYYFDYGYGGAGYTDVVNATLAPYGASLGDLISVSTDRDSGISSVYNKICH